MGEKISIGFMIMLKGMLGIFAVSVFLIIAILIVNLCTSGIEEKK